MLKRMAILAPLLLAACDPGSGLPPMSDYTPGGYRLGGGDEVRIITFGAEQLSGKFRIDDQGDLAIPLLGNVHAAGTTPEQLASMLDEEFSKRNLLRNPSVSVEVTTYRPIFVLGEVNRPGQYPYQPGMTMLTAVAVAGGFTYRAVEDEAQDIRTVNGQVEKGRITPQSLLAPGDVVKIFERHF